MTTRPDLPRLDRTDRALLLALSRDGRRPGADLAKELGLSRQAVTERLRELERRGVIRGYHADIDPIALGLGVRAQLRITLDGKAPQKEKDVLRRLTASPLVRSVYRVSGEDCFVAEVVCRRIQDVGAILGISPGHVRVLLHRAREHVRRCPFEEMPAVSASALRDSLASS